MFDTAHRSYRRIACLIMALGLVLGACSARPSTAVRSKPTMVAVRQSASFRTAAVSQAVQALAPGASWSYLDSGRVPAGWANPEFDDQGWRTGQAPLGARNPGILTTINRVSPAHLSDLFRNRFSVSDPAAITGLELRLMADDAALVYLNGVLVLNDNVGSDGFPESYRGSTTGESDYRAFQIDPESLRAGVNVLAVELRQDHRKDADSGFDLGLTMQSESATTTTTTSTTVPTTTASTSTTVPTTTASTTTTVPTTTASTTTTVPVPVAPAGWTTLHWSDEFSGAALNTSTWKPYHSTYGEGNNELQCLTPNNLSVGGGTLKITAKRETLTCPNGSVRSFSSGFIGTRETGTYFPVPAYYEIRAKLPHAQGLWPAFWLRHRNGSSTAEVDVMEYFHSQVPGKTTQTLHLNGVSNVSKKTSFVETPSTSPGWHTWGVAIEPVSGGWRFTMYTDGVAVHSYTDTTASWASAASSSAMFDIAVNLAVGGNWVGHPDDALGVLSNLARCAQGGTYPNACTSTGIRRAAFPEQYEVDYVRVFTR